MYNGDLDGLGVPPGEDEIRGWGGVPLEGEGDDEYDRRFERERGGKCKEWLQKLVEFNRVFWQDLKKAKEGNNLEEKLKLVERALKIGGEKGGVDKMIGVLLNDRDLAPFIEHDLQEVLPFIRQPLLYIRQEREIDQEDVDPFIDNWSRFYVSFSDILSRAVSKEDLQKHCQNEEVELDIVGDALSRWQEEGRMKIKKLDSRSGESTAKVFDLKDWVEIEDSVQEIFSQADFKYSGQVGILGNAIWNIMRNGVKSSPEGTKVKIEAEIDSSGQLHIFIMNNGGPIGEKQLDYNSDKFLFRRGEITSTTGGSGLGLAGMDKRFKATGMGLRVIYKLAGHEEPGLLSTIEGDTLVGDELSRHRLGKEGPAASTMFEIVLNKREK
jgi:hypothetical protein